MALLEKTYLIRVLSPYYANLRKRLVKSPKIYLRDSGLLHALLDIQNQNDLLGHPVYGASWEGFVIEKILMNMPDWRPSFYRSASGAEIDLLLEKGNRLVAIEIIASSAPELKRSFFSALSDLKTDLALVVAPVDAPYPYNSEVQVVPLDRVVPLIKQSIGVDGM